MRKRQAPLRLRNDHDLPQTLAVMTIADTVWHGTPARGSQQSSRICCARYRFGFILKTIWRVRQVDNTELQTARNGPIRANAMLHVEQRLDA